MFLGHVTLAFAIVVFGATLYEVPRERALALGIAAGLFALVPDADIVYAFTGFLRVNQLSASAAASAFWAASTVVHRSITHSLLVAVSAASGFGLFVVERRSVRVSSIAVLALLVSAIFLVSGPLGVLVTVAFLLVGGLVVILSTAHLDLDAHEIGAVALIGFISHPFGDLLTGEPPAFLYPLGRTLLDARPEPFADATLNLLAAFGLELVTIWAGLLAFLWLTERRIWTHIRPRAVVGGVYALAALVIQPPTLDSSYLFVFSVIAVGSVGVHPRTVIDRSHEDVVTMAVTGLTAVTVAGAGYAITYALTGAI